MKRIISFHPQARRGAAGRRRTLAAAASCAALIGCLAVGGPAHADNDLVIRDFVLTHGVYQREPIDTAESFSPADERGTIFARITNEGAPTNVTVVVE